jgi:cytochrome P450
MLAFSETTVTSIMTFILAMLKYPEVQKQAQIEIDAMVGHDALPDFHDVVSGLPYLSAIIKEVLRFVILIGENTTSSGYLDGIQSPLWVYLT